jgi:hypothetical protein
MNHGVTTAQQISAGVAMGGGGLSFLAEYSSEITVITVVLTAIASVIFGVWNAKIQSRRNKINRRNVIEDIINDLEKCGKNASYVDEFRQSLRK